MLTAYFPKKGNRTPTAKEVEAWRALQALRKKKTEDVIAEEVKNVKGLTAAQKSALEGLHRLGKETKRSIALAAVQKAVGAERLAAMSPSRRERLILTEMENQRKEAERKFMTKLHTLRRMRETKLTKRLADLRPPTSTTASSAISPKASALIASLPKVGKGGVVTLEQMGERLRVLREGKKTPSPVKEDIKKTNAPSRRTRKTASKVDHDEKVRAFEQKLNKDLALYKKTLQQSGQFSEKQIAKGLELMKKEQTTAFYNKTILDVGEELLETRLQKLHGMKKGGWKAREMTYKELGSFPSPKKSTKKPRTIKKKRKKDEDDDSHDDDGDDGDDGDDAAPVMPKKIRRLIMT